MDSDANFLPGSVTPQSHQRFIFRADGRSICISVYSFVYPVFNIIYLKLD